MRIAALILLILVIFTIVPFAQAYTVGQEVPFSPPSNVTGSYTYSQGNDLWEVNTNFPVSSQDVVYPDWLFGAMIVFMVITIYFGLIFMSKDPAPWVNVMACGVLIFGLGLSAALMAPLVGYTQIFHQIVPTTTECGAAVLNATNTVYVNEIVVYTMGSWISYACYGIAVGGGLIFLIAGFLLQIKQARLIANRVQSERIQAEEIDFRMRSRK